MTSAILLEDSLQILDNLDNRAPRMGWLNRCWLAHENQRPSIFDSKGKAVMRDLLLWTTQLGIVIFILSGLAAILGRLKKKEWLHQGGLLIMAVIGPCTLFVCYEVQEMFRAEDAVFWSRLMAGDVSKIWGIGSLGVIAGSGFALGALALTSNSFALFVGAIFFACSWYVLYLHPKPHYVPFPAWLDKLIWFATIVGGAAACIFVFYKLRHILKLFLTPITLLAGILGLVSGSLIYSQIVAQRPLELSTMEPKDRILTMGCLSCHTMDERGYAEPGGPLELVASRSESTVRAFLQQPDKETAERLGIRNPATGEMAGVKLTDEQVELLTEALMSLLKTKTPPAQKKPNEAKPDETEGAEAEPDEERVEAILAGKFCLDCHAVQGEGPPGGGLGGDLSQATTRSEAVLVEWLMEPTAEKAEELGIREDPSGSMANFALEQEDAEAVARWLKTLEE